MTDFSILLGSDGISTVTPVTQSGVRLMGFGQLVANRAR
jgi:hypothetical protein